MAPLEGARLKRSCLLWNSPYISVGSVVIIVDENLPRNLWLKGRETNTIPAKDGQVRRATIKTQHGVLDRPATKIAVLDVGLEDGN